MRRDKINSTIIFLIIFCCSITKSLIAQVSTFPIQENKVIRSFNDHNPNYTWGQQNNKMKWSTRDTLSLPFFDDFSTSLIYPDSSKWLNNQVYINNHFPKFPPTLNVATFDVLDSKGAPYNLTINKDYTGPGDSLISQPINLQDSAGIAYSLSDSIMLSFYYQPNGYGYHLNEEDSLRLFFRAVNGTWLQAWSVAGLAQSDDFKHVIIPIENANFLHSGFQFMFTTLTRQVGNANHWHIDYVLLNNRRSSDIGYYNDYAIQTTPTSLLKDYYSMPYEHFMVNANSHMPDSIFVFASNLYNRDKNIEIKHTATFDGNTLVNSVFSANANNIFAQNNAERRLKSYPISGLTSDEPIVINRRIEIREKGIVNDFLENDFIEVKQTFSDYYAYDDGTAERGFGFDQNTNPKNIEGEIAYKFNLEKEDTLYAISTFFNQSVFDVTSSRFKYKIWQSLTGVDGADQDSVIYISEDQNPSYNQFNDRRVYTAHYPDTLLLLQPGNYYIGWYQSSMYNLNVGWDMNYGNQRIKNKTNPNLYYKLFGNWSNKDLPNGTLMMRPHFGSSKELHAGIDKRDKKVKMLRPYPNPTSDVVNLREVYNKVEIIDFNGTKLIEKMDSKSIDVNTLSSGFYYIRATTESGEVLTSKLCIFAK
mgnify:FL=1